MWLAAPRASLTLRERPLVASVLAVVFALVLAAPVGAQLVPAGGPWRLDDFRPPVSPWEPMVLLVHPDGGFLALWQWREAETSRVLGRRFGASGPVGVVLDFGSGALADAAIAPDRSVVLAGGGFLRRLSLEGRALGAPWAYDDGWVEPGTERCLWCVGGSSPDAALAVGPSGEILVAWPTVVRFTDPDVPVVQLGQLLVRRFDGLGSPLGGSSPIASAYAFWHPDVSAVGDGTFLVAAAQTYNEAYEFDGGLRILVRADGNLQTMEPAWRVWEMRTAVAPGGRSLAVFTQSGEAWESDDGDCTGAFGLLADTAGDLGSGPIDLPRDPSDCQWQARVAAGPDGFVVGWQTDRWRGIISGPAANPFHGVSLRRFDLDGRPVGDPLDLRLGRDMYGPDHDDPSTYDPSLTDLAFAGGRAAVLGVGRGGVWAALAAPVPAGSCRPGGDHLCLGGAAGDRFRVDAAYLDPYSGGTAGGGLPHPLTADSGAFWFFGPENLELLVKVLDGRSVNGRFWVFAGGATTVEWWVTVTDTASREQWGRSVPPYRLRTVADVTALPRPPSAPLADPSLAPGPGLAGTQPEVELGGRYRVRVTWSDPRSGTSGTGRGLAATGDTALFWFFGPANVELLVKVLDGRTVNGHAWVFWASLTDVAFELVVEDTQGGTTWVARKEAFELGGGADTAAFP